MRSQERIDQMNDLITGIARRSAYKFQKRTLQDIVQDLWITALEKEKAMNEELDLDLLAKICYDRIVDLLRYDSYRNHMSFDQLFGQGDLPSFIDYREDCSSTGGSILKNCYEPSAEKVAEAESVKEIFELFPIGSKERQFLEYWSTYANVEDFGVVGEGCYNEGFTESDLAHKLGYSGTSSGGYKSFRKKMRNFVTVYFDISNK